MSVFFAILTFVVSGIRDEKDLQHVNYSSSDARFTVICDAQKTPPFKVVASQTGRAVLTLAREQLGSGGVELDWAPDEPVLVVLVHQRPWDQVRVWRFGRGQPIDCSPAPPQDSFSMAPWFASNKLRLKGHKRTYTLTVGTKDSRLE